MRDRFRDVFGGKQIHRRTPQIRKVCVFALLHKGGSKALSLHKILCASKFDLPLQFDFEKSSELSVLKSFLSLAKKIANSQPARKIMWGQQLKDFCPQLMQLLAKCSGQLVIAKFYVA